MLAFPPRISTPLPVAAGPNLAVHLDTSSSYGHMSAAELRLPILPRITYLINLASRAACRLLARMLPYSIARAPSTIKHSFILNESISDSPLADDSILRLLGFSSVPA